MNKLLCNYNGCKTEAFYGFLNTKIKQRCTKHQKFGMVNLRRKCPLCTLNFDNSKLCISCVKYPDIEKRLILQYLRHNYIKLFNDNSFNIIILVNDESDELYTAMQKFEQTLNSNKVCIFNIKFDLLRTEKNNNNISRGLSKKLERDLSRICRKVNNVHKTLINYDELPANYNDRIFYIN